MKSKTTFKNTKLILLTIGLFLSVLKIQAQACVGNKVLIYIDNVTATSNALEYDIFVKNIGTTDLKMANFGGNVLYGDNFLPTGATGTLTVVDDPSQIADFPTLNSISQAQHASAFKQLRWAQPPVTRNNAVELPANVALKFARFRFESSIPWDINSETDLTFPISSQGGISVNVMSVYCNQNTAASTVISYSNSTLVLQDETATTPSVHINMFRLLASQGFNSESQATVYPNPFEQSFKLTSSAAETLKVTVSDMTGRMVEQRQFDASTIEKQEFGYDYPSGFYLVSVVQGNQNQTFKLLKK